MGLLDELGDEIFGRPNPPKKKRGRRRRPGRRSRRRSGEAVAGEGVAVDVSLTDALRQWDSRPEPHRGAEKLTHLSSLLRPGYQGCARHEALRVTDGSPVYEHPSPAMRIVWALGRAAEVYVRRSLIDAFGMGNVYGAWRCGCAGPEPVTVGLGDPSWRCGDCGGGMVYGEVALVDEDLEVVGSPDLLHLTREGALDVTEIKSITRKGSHGIGSVLKAGKAKAEHRAQASGYRDMIQRGALPYPEGTARVLYVCKEFEFGKSPYHVFDLPPRDSAPTLRLMWERAEAFRDWRKTGELPGRLTACSAPDQPPASGCPLCANCFLRDA